MAKIYCGIASPRDPKSGKTFVYFPLILFSIGTKE